MKTKYCISLFVMTCVTPLSSLANVWQDPETKVNYEYTVGKSEASVKSGTSSRIGSPDASGDIDILKKFTINNQDYVVTSIGDYAFYRCKDIISVNIPESVTSIGKNTFYKCTGLTKISIDIPSSLTSIGENAFYGCSNLDSITIPKSVSSISNYAFYNCSGLSSINLLPNVCEIGMSVFSGCTNITNVTINFGTVSTWFKGYKAIKTIVLGEGVSSISSNAFNGCTGLTNISLPSSLEKIGSSAFSGCTSLNSITIPKGVTSIGENAFQQCTNLTDITINCADIGKDWFKGLATIQKVTLGEDVSSIGKDAFLDCTGLTEVHITNISSWCGIDFISTYSNPLYYAKHLFLNGDEVTDLVIPEGVTNIGNCAFINCENINNFNIPSSVTSIGAYSFYGTGWYNEQPSGILFHDKWLLGEKNGYSYYLIIEEGTKGIASRALYGNSYLSSVTIPESMLYICDEAFFGCINLYDFNIPLNVKSIGRDAFFCPYYYTYSWWSKQSKGIVYKDGWILGYNVDKPKEELTIAEGTRGIASFALNTCNGITSITIPSSVTSIGKGAFYGCTGLTNVISLIQEPFVIDESVFQYEENNTTIFTSAILNVPQGTKAKYTGTPAWNKFKTILVIGDPVPMNGDVNGDLVVDVADISSVIDVMARSGNDTTADVNGDGIVDVADISSIISIMAANGRIIND